MLIDEIKIYLKAGGGGNGVVRWRHEKGKELAGPGGGNGGKGGDVFVQAIRDIGGLLRYRHVKELSAGRGGDGENFGRHGKNGPDLFLELPVGSVLVNEETRERFELLNENETLKILQGGRGGLGNEHFKTSLNTSPRESTLGSVGETADFSVELQLFADAGLIGLPNAGKSSLLNALSAAHAKVGDYPFTTLEPNLGALYGFVLADIPGLIEGAAEGKGLGHKFLRHIRRTKILLHCISLENFARLDDHGRLGREDIKTVWKTIRGELEKYDTALLKKKEIIILTKTDLVNPIILKKTEKIAKKLCQDVFSVSILDEQSIKNFSDSLVKILREL
ncbi:MAG: GTPase obg [Parcubacteria group bacterium GW2011_GWB1_44_7]|nr:MAG: GTPase obg [Parcubacteria group bacterium GW2011_GWB1_44_7]